jgi:hypothetical protein
MPLIKLNRINKGGEILLNSEHIVSIEIEARSPTVHLTAGGGLFSVEETPAAIVQIIEQIETDRIRNGIVNAGLGVKPLSQAPPPALPENNP